MPAAAPSRTAPGASLDELARRWFPLVPRAKPRCEPLTGRIARVRDLVEQARQDTSDSLSCAAQAHSLAALILSDCAMPTQARELCRRQARLFADAGPFDLPTAKLALQPIINLGRLLTRDGNGSAAHQHFQTLFQAAQAGTDTEIGGLPARFGSLTRHAEEQREIIRWLWTILLSDGTRALTSAGRWSDAATQAQQHNGVGQRLIDGRQILVLAHCANRDYTAASRIIKSSAAPTAWEQAVAACLDGMCRTWSSQPDEDGPAPTISGYLTATPADEPVLFRVRLGLSAACTCSQIRTTQQTKIARIIVREALDSADAYPAHELITHPAGLTRIPPHHAQELRDVVQKAGLGAETLPSRIIANLMMSARASEAEIASTLRR
jgi:hypothetical protein